MRTTSSGHSGRRSNSEWRPARVASRGRHCTIGESFSGNRNSLNFLRLVLALTVICSHALTLGGSGSVTAEDVLNTTPGSVAVFGFFGISGFLIARSASRNHFGRYLWQRFLRIFPGYWVCLLVTGLILGVIAWGHTGQAFPPHCGLSCYFRSPTGPFQYLYHNALLRTNQSAIAGTPRRTKTVALPYVWNVSLWTLQYEFACYLLLGIMALAGVLKRRLMLVTLAVTVWLGAAYVTFTQNGSLTFDQAKMLGLFPLFLAGSLLYLYRDKIPDSGFLALASTSVFVASLWLPFGSAEAFSFFPRLNAPILFSFALVYPMIWLGIHLPLHRVGAHNDYSYGTYVYASPVQQLLAIWGVQRWGMATYMVLGVAGTMPLAFASWWIVEKHALTLKKIAPRRPFRLRVVPVRTPTSSTPTSARDPTR
jgi:peptidoglycan/LPS O-acetylase OafA/YrhL